MVDAHLVAECEWGNLGDIYDDFEKLLLARSGVRLMVYTGWTDYGGPVGIAKRLARKVGNFNGSCSEDSWLLAGWQSDGSERGWSFRYFTIKSDGTIEEYEDR